MASTDDLHSGSSESSFEASDIDSSRTDVMNGHSTASELEVTSSPDAPSTWKPSPDGTTVRGDSQASREASASCYSSAPTSATAASASGAVRGRSDAFYPTEVMYDGDDDNDDDDDEEDDDDDEGDDNSPADTASSYATGATERFTSCSEASSYYTEDGSGSMAVGGACRFLGSCEALRRSDLDLIQAAERGDTNSVKTLLSSEQVSSVDIGLGSTYRTPLHRAAGYGQEEVVRMLLDARAMVGCRDVLNRTPLHEACSGGYVRCLKMLLMADGTAHIDVADKGGITAAHMAAMNGESECLEMVLDHGCDPCAEDATGKTAAHHAVKYDHSRALKCLIDRGIEVDCLDQEGQAPAHIAALTGSLTCLKMLASSGVDMCSADDRGQQPCHLAAERNRVNCLKFLLKSGGAELAARDKSGRTLLHIAAENGSLDCLHWLLEGGMSASCLDGKGQTPLHAAAKAGEAMCFHCLQQHGGNLDLKDAMNRLPINVARENGHALEVMQAVEEKITCTLCMEGLAIYRKRRSDVGATIAKLQTNTFSRKLSVSQANIPVPPKLASILQQANTSKSTSRLPPLSSRRGSVGSSAQQQTRTAHRRESADLSRDVVASMVYGHGKDTRRGSGFSGSDFGSSDFRFGK